jgi:DNA-binding transcriptional LysR family regulator
VNLAGVDLNLLVALQALLQERNVTRAARVVGISQPAMSNALRRLRRLFDDPLLVRDGRGLALTPAARELQHAVEPALAMVERVLRIQASFDPASATQQYRIAASDYGMIRIAERLRGLESAAPGITVDLIQVDQTFVRDGESVVKQVDLLVAPQAYLQDVPHAVMWSDPWVAVVDARRGAPAIGEADLGGAPLVGLFHDVGAGAHIERLLTVRGISTGGAVNVESFTAVPALVEHTDRVGFLPASLARRVAGAFDVRLLEVPSLTEPLVECLYWHRSADNDPAHLWLRRFLLEHSDRADASPR